MDGSRVMGQKVAGPGSVRGNGESTPSSVTLMYRLSAAFGAPVGVVDPRNGVWVGNVGAPAEAFPAFGLGMLTTTAAHDRVVVSPAEHPGEAVWLLLPVRAEAGTLVAAAGFAATQ